MRGTDGPGSVVTGSGATGGVATGEAENLLALAVDVAGKAGRLVREARQGQVRVAATKSSPTDIVTAVDVESERLIRREIAAVRPDDAFVGEEGADVTGSSGVTWIADPIDGTVNFLYGIPQYAVSIAARVGTVVVAGVVHNPASGETFTATRGGGARLNDEPISVSSCRSLAEALVGIGYHYVAEVRSYQSAETSHLLPVVRDVRRLGSAALDLCFVACGRLDAYVERGLKPWDHAAGELIATEAGALVGGLGGSPVSELIIAAAPRPFFSTFEQALVAAGFADWPLPSWPG
jgi:myo-inositol-1(or 4)-monophosphatase